MFANERRVKISEYLSSASSVTVSELMDLFHVSIETIRRDLELIKQIHIAKYFLAPSAISLKFGISDFVKEMIPVQRAFLESSDQVIVLADSSKFETESNG